jgi:hypothetical protein
VRTASHWSNLHFVVGFVDLVDADVTFSVADVEETAVRGEAELGDFAEAFELLEALTGAAVYYAGIRVGPAPAGVSGAVLEA